MNRPHVAVVSLGPRVLHVVGPFPTAAEAATEGESVRQAVEMFKRLEEQEVAELSVVPLYANMDALMEWPKG